MNSANQQKLIDNMVRKSQEAFYLAIELFNKPTIELRVEGFCYFICNAWEMMLKAYLLKNHKRIYYKDKKNTNRTISLTECIRSILTNDKDPVRINLEVIVGIRNTATHLIVPEYAALLSSVFLACVKNYTTKLNSYFGINVAERLSGGLLSMFIPDKSSKVEILQKYGKSIAQMYNSKEKFLLETFKENSKDGNVSDNLAVSMQVVAIRTTDKSKADIKIYKNSKNALDSDAKVIYKSTDPSETHPYNRSKILEKILEEISLRNLTYSKPSSTSSDKFNSYYFDIYCKYKRIKQNPYFCYKHEINKNAQYTYSLQLVPTIIDDITEDPDIFIKAKNYVNSKNKKS